MFEIFVDGRNFGTEGAALSVVVRYGNKNEWRRGFKCGKLTTNQTELKGLLYGLLSIKEQFYKLPIMIFTRSKYMSLMLTMAEGKWTKPIDQVEKNRELIGSIREQLEKFGKWQIAVTPDHPRLKEIGPQTEAIIKEKKEYFVKI